MGGPFTALYPPKAVLGPAAKLGGRRKCLKARQSGTTIAPIQKVNIELHKAN